MSFRLSTVPLVVDGHDAFLHAGEHGLVFVLLARMFGSARQLCAMRFSDSASRATSSEPKGGTAALQARLQRTIDAARISRKGRRRSEITKGWRRGRRDGQHGRERRAVVGCEASSAFSSPPSSHVAAEEQAASHDACPGSAAIIRERLARPTTWPQAVMPRLGEKMLRGGRPGLGVRIVELKRPKVGEANTPSNRDYSLKR